MLTNRLRLGRKIMDLKAGIFVIAGLQTVMSNGFCWLCPKSVSFYYKHVVVREEDKTVYN